MTCKRRIYFDGNEVTTVQKYTYEFSYSFTYDNHYYSIQQVNPTMYDLRIDNLGFNYIVNELKKENKKIDDKDNFIDDKKSKEQKIDKNVYKEVDDDFFKVNSNTKNTSDINNFNDKDFVFEDSSNKSNAQNKTNFEDIFG